MKQDPHDSPLRDGSLSRSRACSPICSPVASSASTQFNKVSRKEQNADDLDHRIGSISLLSHRFCRKPVPTFRRDALMPRSARPDRPAPSMLPLRTSRLIGLGIAFVCGLVLPNIAQAQTVAQAGTPASTSPTSTAIERDNPERDGVSSNLTPPRLTRVGFTPAKGAQTKARPSRANRFGRVDFEPIAIAPFAELPPLSAFEESVTPVELNAIPRLNPIPGFLQKKRLRKAVKRLYVSWTQKGAKEPGGALQSAAAAAIASPSAAARISAPSATSIANNPREQRVLIASGTVTTTTLGSSQSQSATTNPAPQNISREAVTRSTPLPVPPPLTQTEAPPVQPRTLAYVEQIRDVLRAQAQNPVAARSPTPAPLAPNVQPASVTGLNPAGTNPAGAEGNLADARSLEQTIANENALVALFSRGSVGARSVGVSPK